MGPMADLRRRWTSRPARKKSCRTSCVRPSVTSTFAFLGLLMWHYQNFSTKAWVYLALLGSYGLAWFIKDMAFPDSAWQRKITVGGGINSFLGVLGWYWVFGWLLISGVSSPAYPLPDGAWYALCISLCLLGTTIMLAADAQKYFTLRHKPGLITGGMFRYVRHPNYLGEMMIYGSFALMVWHWLPVVVLAWVWNMPRVLTAVATFWRGRGRNFSRAVR